MEFKIEKRENPNTGKYKADDISTAYAFSERVIREFGAFVKCIALFGSTIRREQDSHDIDLLIIVDDISIVVSPELAETYRVLLEKIIIQSSRKLHVTTLRMTNFWDYMRKGDPIGLNILRDGVALYDINLFEPLRILLQQGKIAPSVETVNVYVNKSSASMYSSQNHLLQAALDLYWSVIDISHAALMQKGITPTSPSHVAAKLEEVYCNKVHSLERKYPAIMDRFYKLSRSIIHNEISSITGQEYERYLKDARDFTDRMKKLVRHK